LRNGARNWLRLSDAGFHSTSALSESKLGLVSNAASNVRRGLRNDYFDLLAFRFSPRLCHD
jgi:hypothetical protein